MSTYLFVLGNNPELSLAELVAMFPSASVEYFNKEVAVIDQLPELSQKDFDRLGGSIKMAEFIAKVRATDVASFLADELRKKNTGHKLAYGLSLYGKKSDELRRLLNFIKKKLVAAGVKSRFANQDFKNLNAAQVRKLMPDAGEWVLLADRGHYFVAHTKAIQDIDAYSKRDFDKPYRDMKVGMLPPKLAQILVNLAVPQGKIWDPFCGGGVILMEAVLAGYSAVGSDIDPTILAGAQKNMDWIVKSMRQTPDFDLFVHDATKALPDITVDAIVTEGYLGPPLHAGVGLRQIEQIAAELTTLYRHFFKALKEGGFKKPIVITFPFFRISGQQIFLRNLLDHIGDLGFALVPLLPSTLGYKYPDICYFRSDQMVGRQIFKFTLKA